MTKGYLMEMLGMRLELGASASMASQLLQTFIPLPIRNCYLLPMLYAITICEFGSYRFFPKPWRGRKLLNPLHGLELHLQFHKIS